MANTYSQLYYHIVFAVRGRANIISAKWRDQLYKYISGITERKNFKLFVINGTRDHIHMLVGSKPDVNLSDYVRDIKANSSKYINENKYVYGHFEWQAGYGVFTVSPTQVKKVISYIENQEEHHNEKSFRREYVELLELSGIDYDEKYLFDEV